MISDDCRKSFIAYFCVTFDKLKISMMNREKQYEIGKNTLSLK